MMDFRNLKLREMSEEEFLNFLSVSADSYARDRMKTDFESYETALEKAIAQRNQLLPQGRKTPLHHFYHLTSEKNPILGSGWLKVDPTSGEAYLYQITVEESFRGQGVGKSLLQMMEAEAKRLGGRVMWLNVMAHNPVAKSLYEGAGYGTATLHMNKLLN